MTNYINVLIEALVPVAVQIIVGVVGILGALFLGQLRKVKALQNVTAAVDLLQGAVIDTVNANQQQLVDDLKATAEDGKLTEGEIAMLQARTIERVKAKVGPAVANVITAAGIDMNQLILDSADAVIREIKAEK